MIFCVTGASGFIGSNLVIKAMKEHEIVILTRNTDKCLEKLIEIKPNIEEYINKNVFLISYADALDAYTYLYGSTQDMSIQIADIDGFIIKIHDKSIKDDIMAIFDKLMHADAIINLAGESVVAKALTKRRIDEITQSRLDVIDMLYTIFLKHDVIHKSRIFLQASATGIYDESENTINESTSCGNNMLASILKEVEERVSSIVAPSHLAILRFGIVIGKNGGIYKALKGIPPFNIIASNHVPYISLDDALEAILFIIKEKKHGIFNFVAPTYCKITQFMHAIFNVKTFLIWVPAFFIKKTDKRSRLLLQNQKIIPEHLLQCGFKFKHNAIKDVIFYMHKR